MTGPVTLDCYNVWAEARRVTPPRVTLTERAALLTDVMAETLARSSVDLLDRRACLTFLSGLYNADDVRILIDAAIEAAERVRDPSTILQRARAL